MTEKSDEVILTHTGSESEPPKLWANKFKTPEDLEKGYGEVVKMMIQSNEISKELELLKQIPEQYTIPETIKLTENELEDIKTISKNAGLNQFHFENIAKQMQDRNNMQLIAFENAKKEIGDENLQVLNGYVKSFYPESIHDHVMTKLIKDKTAMKDAMDHRDKLLNSSVPGLDKGSTRSPERYDGERELLEVAKIVHSNPRDIKAREKYIKLANEVGNARFSK